MDIKEIERQIMEAHKRWAEIYQTSAPIRIAGLTHTGDDVYRYILIFSEDGDNSYDVFFSKIVNNKVISGFNSIAKALGYKD